MNEINLTEGHFNTNTHWETCLIFIVSVPQDLQLHTSHAKPKQAESSNLNKHTVLHLNHTVSEVDKHTQSYAKI